MKILYPFIALTLITMITLSCDNSDKDTVRDAARSSLRDLPPGSVPAPAATSNALATSNVKHYICPNNCEGSGGAAAGTCPVCGSEYQHNDAYHNQQQSTTPSIDLGNSPATTATTPEPAQNTAGVWHYTCPNGCAGGAGAAGKCATCGGDLAHNTAYHSQNANTEPVPGQTINLSDFTTTPGTPPVSTSVEPAQNAAGVWHYTCPKGCAGGGGSAGKCATCGGDLAHNTAYHN